MVCVFGVSVKCVCVCVSVCMCAVCVHGVLLQKYVGYVIVH